MTVDQMYMDIAKTVAKTSPNLGRKTSAVFVRNDSILVMGANTFPEGVQRTNERFMRPACYQFIEHAERIAIGEAAYRGIALADSTVYIPWFPCVECARMLVCAGVSTMVCIEPDWDSDLHHTTKYYFREARAILEEGCVTIRYHVEEN